MSTVDLLAVASHPDDVELRCAGLLLKLHDQGYRTGILDLTRGEMGTRGTPEERAREAAAAADLLGVTFRENAGLPDGRLAVTEEARLAVARAVRACRPRLLVAPYWKDSHPDHSVTGELAHQGAFIAGLRHYPGLDGDPWRPGTILYWASHYDIRPSFVVDTSAYHERRMEAVRCFASQLHQPDSQEPQTNIASADFLNRISMLAQYHGEMIGVRYGEGYLVRQVLPVEDPIALLGDSDREWNGLTGMLSLD
jgi:bacillithiol biosynthesis deacetylase BshB1